MAFFSERYQPGSPVGGVSTYWRQRIRRNVFGEDEIIYGINNVQPTPFRRLTIRHVQAHAVALQIAQDRLPGIQIAMMGVSLLSISLGREEC